MKGSNLLDATSPSLPAGFSRVRLFLALSRTPHGLLDLATPALAAILWIGGLPPLRVMALGLLTVFAGYTAIYALNDVVDYRVDREKMRQAVGREQGSYLDAMFMRHPMAQGQISLKEGILWTLAWAGIALIGAYHLNPVCALIFLVGCLLEAVYCLLLRISHFRTLVSGLVKTLGGIAAVFAVDPHPSPLFLLILFLWLFFWEIGGQNVPADWHDLEEDKHLRAQTIPTRYGPRGSSTVILGSLLLSVALSALLLRLTPIRFSLSLLGLSLAAGLYFLLLPALSLYKTEARDQASALFNRASYYPLALLLVFLLQFIS